MAEFSRHQKREIIFELLYESEFNSDKSSEEIFDNAVSLREIPDDAFVKETFIGARSSISDIDSLIEATSNNWKISRMSIVTRSVLRLACFEMKKTETPVKVIINEALEIVKKYDDIDSARFVNGILNHIGLDLGLIQK